MEAHRSLQAPNDDEDLVDFIVRMPRLFYGSSPHRAKRLGGIVASGKPHSSDASATFAEKVGTTVASSRVNCQAAIIHIVDFPQFRDDLYEHLWNIY